MRADSVHGSIGRRMKKSAEVCNFDEFVDICTKSAQSIKPIVMQHGDFYQVPEMHRTRTSKKVQLPKISEIRSVKFSKGSRSLTYKRKFDSEEVQVEFLKKNCDVHQVIPTATVPRGVSSTKKQNLIKLAKSLPPSKVKFWHDLHVNDDNADLVACFE